MSRRIYFENGNVNNFLTWLNSYEEENLLTQNMQNANNNDWKQSCKGRRKIFWAKGALASHYLKEAGVTGTYVIPH